MKTKNIYKIGICLVIALTMILPTSIMASNVSPKDAGESQIQQDYEAIALPTDLYSMNDPEVTSMGVKLNDNIITPDEIIPYEDVFEIQGGTIVTPPCNPQDPPLIQGGMSIYSVDEGIEVPMYETSFEDNFDIYNNWIQIDVDCGIMGGHFDSWSWSDARSSDGDHSMKSTMYEIYKGNQDDLLRYNGPCLDATGQYAVNFSFDIWVEGQDNKDQDGQYGYAFEFYDYVDFEVYDGASWIDITATEFTTNPFGLPMYFSDTENTLLYGIWLYGYPVWDMTWFVEELGDGWWHVWWQAPISWFSDPSCISFGFSWHTDPQFQYEGAYIDNVKVMSVEGVKEKIFQTHLQECTEISCDHTWTDYPLDWNCPGPGDYEIIYWVETENCPTAGIYDSNFPKPGETIPFKVRDDFDCEITSLEIEDSFTHTIIPPEGRMNEGADAHIMFTYHQGGNLPGENIPIELHIYKKTWEEVMSFDMESTMGWDPSLNFEFSFTDYDSWSGSKSMYFGNDDFMHVNDGLTGIALTSQTIDFEEYEEATADWYYSISVPAGDNVKFGFWDDYSGYTLTDSASQMTGFSDGWIGPDQPRGKYHGGVDLVGMYNYFVGLGFFRDSYGDIVTKVPFVFRLTEVEDGVIFHPDNLDWSGCFIDDFVISGLYVGDEVFSDTMIIPGPVEVCETVNAQFEWEDVPFSRYRICVNTACEDDVDETNNEMCQQIIVFDDLERLSKPESVDNTDGCNGEWGICGSDTDNYLSTNPNSEFYAADANVAVYLDDCVDFCDMGLTIHDTAYPGIFAEDFSSGLGQFTSAAVGEFYGHPGSEAGGTAPQACIASGSIVLPGATMTSGVIDLSMLDEATISYKQLVHWVAGSFNVRLQANDGISGWVDVHLNTVTADIAAETVTEDLFSYITPTANTQIRFWINGVAGGELGWWCIDDVIIDGVDLAPDQILLEFDAWCDFEGYGYDYVYLDISDDCEPDQETDWVNVERFAYWPDSSYDNALDWTYIASSPVYLGDGWWHYVFDLSSLISDCDFTIRFWYESDGGWQARGFLVDDLSITGWRDDDGDPIVDTMDTMDNWYADCKYIGDYWDTTSAPYCITIPFLPLDNSMVWATEIEDAYEAWLTMDFTYDLADTSCIPDVYGFQVDVEISADGGSTWYILDELTGAATNDVNVYDITYLAGNPLLIKATAFFNGPVDSIADAYSCGTTNYFCINDGWITGKSDDTAPTSTATMSGTMKESGWYTTSVKITVTATDEGAGMGEIHYIVDGTENVVSGDTATFTVSGNGEHDVEYWAVDAMGNEEAHHIIPAFRIDAGAPPSVAITAPEPGLYLFGNKLLSASKVIIIGAFTVEATASDADSGIYRVQFYLDGDLISEDTTVPFSAYIAEKHMGAGTIKVVAEDYAQNTAEDTLDVTYYKFL